MRFLFEFVSCCGLPTHRSPEPAVPAEDDDASLAPATVPAAVSSRSPCRKQVRMGSADWRPSLRSISEDATPPRGRESHRNRAGRDAKKRTGVGSTNVRYRSYSDSYSGSAPSMPSMMPTFSPTPFMF